MIELRGEPRAVAQVLASPPDGSTIIVDKTTKKVRRVTLKMIGQTTYRQIGGFIYGAQASKVTVIIKTEPPICGMDK